MIAWCIRNPLIVLVMTLGIAVAGMWSWQRVPVDAIPDLSDNQVIVWAEWPGKSPEDIDVQITGRLARELQGLPGVQTVRGLSLSGSSYVYVIFDERRNLYDCRTRVLERLGQIQSVLPVGVSPRLGPDASAMGQVFAFTLQGKRDVIYLVDKIKDAVELRDAIGFVASDNPETKTMPNYSERLDFIPSKNFKITVDSSAVLANNYLSRKYANKIVDKMEWSINRNYITKSDLMILDILAQNNWKRPVYFAITVSRENYLNLDQYMQITGLTYKVVPMKSEAAQGEISNIDTKLVYDNLMTNFRWGGISNPKVYLDENNIRMLSNFRNSFSKLAEALIAEGKPDSAVAVLDRGMELMPEKCVPYNYFALPFADIYYRLNKKDKAEALVTRVGDIYEKELNYYFRLSANDRILIDNDIRIALQIMRQLSMLAKQYGNKELDQKFEASFAKYVNMYQPGS